MKLDYFAIKNNTDKSTLVHGYCNYYDDAIQGYLRNHVTESFSLLEIGVYSGASLKMWSDYFRDLRIKHNIIGVDLEPAAIASQDLERNIRVEIGDQSDIEFLRKLGARYGLFDVIVDDGSHQCDHQKISFTSLFEFLKPGGIYIVEDVCTSYWAGFNNNGSSSMIEYCKALIDEVNFRGIRPENKDSREARRLIDHVATNNLGINTSIESIHFFNSTILIHKR